MSSWLNKNNSLIPRRQSRITPEGRFIQKDKPATVVSAYYEMDSKHSSSDYTKWIEIFLKNNEMYLIFFTEAHLANFIQECRRGHEERTTIIILPREEWRANKYEQKVWDTLHSIDPEKSIHTPELYKIWFEKPEFVKRGIELNPYGHDDFLWVDSGICRKESLKKIIPNFPDASRIPIDRMMLLNVSPFNRSDNEKKVVNGIQFIGGVISKERIGGGVICGRKEIWEKYYTLYYATLDKYKNAGLFWGKDQDIMKTMVIENKGLFSLIEPMPILQTKWQYLLLYLGSVTKVFERMLDEKLNKEVKSNEELLKIGDNNASVIKGV
jgi:hypothetical protein